MRIAFVTIGNSRRSGYLDGDSLRNGGSGGSGTDTTNILVAEYLASKGHEVVLASEKLETELENILSLSGKHFPSGRIVRGVQYCNMDFDGVENREFDILHSCLWFQDYAKLPIKVTKALIYHNHMQWVYGIDEMIAFCRESDLKLGFVDISQWQRSHTQGYLNRAKDLYGKVSQTLIPNPVMDDVIREVLAENIPKKKHKFVFHPLWARGGDVAVKAVRELGYEDSEFHAFTYLLSAHQHPDSFFHNHMGVDKQTLFRHLAESEYFLYPLYTPYGHLHSDTFSCVVAEAIAFGVKVITYPIAALPENFDKYVHWLDFPEGVADVDVNNVQLYNDPEGKFNTSDNIVQAVRALEEHPVEIVGGSEYILDNFGMDRIGKMWVDFINELTKE